MEGAHLGNATPARRRPVSMHIPFFLQSSRVGCVSGAAGIFDSSRKLHLCLGGLSHLFRCQNICARHLAMGSAAAGL